MQKAILICAAVSLSNAIKLKNGNKYEESEGPTKADNGDSDHMVVYRESDINEKGEKFSGWTNPLSWTDDGADDDQVVNMRFAPLDEDREDTFPGRRRGVDWEYDEDIVTSMSNERDAEKSVRKHAPRYKAEREAR